MVAFNRKTVDQIEVRTGHVPSRCKKTHHARNKTRTHYRPESGSIPLGPEPDLMEVHLRSEREHWERKRDRHNHIKVGEFEVSCVSDSTIELLKASGIDVGRISPMSEFTVEPLVRRVVTEMKPYKEKTKMRKAPKLKELKSPASGKGARPRLGKFNPNEVQLVYADGTTPPSNVGTGMFATPADQVVPEEIKRVEGKEDNSFKVSIMCARAYIVKNRMNNAIMQQLAPFYRKVGDEWQLMATVPECPYKIAHYRAAWADIVSRLS